VLGADGVRELLAQLPASVRRLELDACRLGPDGAELLLASDRVRDLVWLHVDDNTVPQDLRPALAALCRLRYVPPQPCYLPDVVEYLPNNKIAAIKMYREHTRAGLADSKMAVERICEELGFGAYWGNRAAPRWVRP
jgi:hypothetical protein